MPFYSAAYCRQKIKQCEAAYAKALEAQSYSINGRSITRASVEKIEAELAKWQTALANALGEPSGTVARSVIIHDA